MIGVGIYFIKTYNIKDWVVETVASVNL